MKHVNPDMLEVKEGDGVEPEALVTKALNDFQKAVDDRLKAIETKSADADKVAGRLDKIEATLNRPGIIAKGDDSGDLERKAFIEFARKGVERMEQKAAAALTVATDASAGYLAPEAFGAEILKKIVEWSPIRNYARVISISAPEIKYPRKLTGVAATWVGETEDRTQSDQTYEQVTFAPHELATFVDVSNQLLEDNAYNLEGELSGDFAEAFAIAESSAFVNGNGTGKPKGLLAAGTGIAEMKTGAAANLGTDPAATVIAMFHAVPSVVAQNGVWVMNRKTLGALRTLKDDNGRFIMVDPITAGMP